jgi:CheY-like chemotaxis protein
VLARHGAKVQIANSGSQAYERIRKQHFDLIVCDQNMPGLSGQSLFRLVASGDPNAADRFLFITGEVGASDSRQFHEQNGVQLLRKPFRIQELLEAVDYLFSRNRQQGS